MSLYIRDVPPDAEQIDILYAEPVVDILTGEPKKLAFQPLKTVAVSTLATTPDGDYIVPLSLGEDAPGRYFDAAVAKTVNGLRRVSRRGGYDYHNRPPYSSGTVRETFFVGLAAGRIDLSPHLYDPDGRPVTLRLVPSGETFGAQDLPGFAQLQGFALLVDASVPRAQTTVAVSIADEKGAVAILNVIFSVVESVAPAPPGAVRYIARGLSTALPLGGDPPLVGPDV